MFDPLVNFLVKNNAKVIKIASIDTNNFSFMELVAQKKIPVIASIGMCNWNEVAITWNIFKKAKCPIMFLHCTSAYPCPIEDKNLNCIPILQNMFKEDIGFSGHGTGPIGTLGAVALGAKVIEKHVTLSRKMSGPDQNASLEFNELKSLIINSNQMQKALGSSIKAFEKSEKTLHGVLAKRIIISKPMKSGEKITASHIRTVVTKKNDGLLPNKYYEILGLKVKNDLKINHVLEFSDLI